MMKRLNTRGGGAAATYIVAVLYTAGNFGATTVRRPRDVIINRDDGAVLILIQEILCVF